MTTVLHLLARTAARLLGRPRVDLAQRLALWTYHDDSPRRSA